MDQSEVVDARAVKAHCGILAWVLWGEASRVKQWVVGPTWSITWEITLWSRGVPSTLFFFANLLTSELLPPTRD